MRLKHTVISLSLLIVGGYLFVSLPLFKIDAIRISGTNRLSATAIASITDQWRGQSLLMVYTLPYYRKVLLSQFPDIASYDIQFISLRRLRFHITEKQPFAALLIEGKSHLIAEDGTRLSNTPSSPESVDHTLIIRGISESEFKDPSLSWFFEIRPLLQLIKTELHHYVIQIEKTDRNEWILFKDDILPFLIGPADSIQHTMTYLPQIMGQLSQFYRPRHGIQYIDLRVLPNVIVGYE